MELQTDVRVEPGYLAVTCRGEFTLDGILDLIGLIARRAEESATPVVLADLSGVTGAPSTMDRFDIGEEVARQLPQVRIAAFGSAPFIDPSRFGAVVANNRGASLGIFETGDEARRWLETTSGIPMNRHKETEREN